MTDEKKVDRLLLKYSKRMAHLADNDSEIQDLSFELKELGRRASANMDSLPIEYLTTCNKCKDKEWHMFAVNEGRMCGCTPRDYKVVEGHT